MSVIELFWETLTSAMEHHEENKIEWFPERSVTKWLITKHNKEISSQTADERNR